MTDDEGFEIDVVFSEVELEQHLNDIQLWYLQDPNCNGILLDKLLHEKIYKHNKTRYLFISFGPKCTYYYAENIDNCPRNDTRSVACKDPWWAYCYAVEVDHCPSLETFHATKNDINSLFMYLEFFSDRLIFDEKSLKNFINNVRIK